MSISTGSSKSLSLRSLGSSTRRSSSLVDDRAPQWKLNQIYGRENESQKIQDHADKKSTGTIVVKGLAGSGKSYLIESQNFEEDGWVFATGKYEGRRKQQPYSALIDALDSVVDQWIENNKNADVCEMTSFKGLLDDDLDLLENILPEAFRCVREYKMNFEECPEASSEFKSEEKVKAKGDARYDAAAINAAFWRILSFLCQAKPIVLFLDDIQWADQASLDAIKVLSSAGNIEGFLLILSYRDDEVKDDDPAWNCLDHISKECDHLETIHVTDLNVQDTNKIVSSLLEKQSERTLELATVIHSKTAGNPFFVVQFIQMLRHESFLSYNFLTLEWEWGNINKLDQLAFVSDNVADVIASNMSKLSWTCLCAIQKASCLGKVVPMQVMIEYFRKCEKADANCDKLVCIPEDGLRKVFRDAVEFGILKRLDNNTFMWAHDKLQHVAYSMQPACSVQPSHKLLGMILWEMHKSNPTSEWMLYMAADQLNRVDMTDDCLCEEVARLSFEAGQLSISKSAFFPALDMLRFAANHLGNMKDSWEMAYELSIDVYSTLAEISLQFLSYEEGLNAAILVDQHAKVLEDKLRAQIVFMRHKAEGGNRDYEGAVKSIQNTLLEYGVRVPTTIMPGLQFLENRKLKARLDNSDGVKTFLKLRKLNEQNIDDKRTCNILRLLAHLLEYTFYHKKYNGLNYYATVRIMNISLKEGTSSDTAMALAHFSGLLGRKGLKADSKEWGDVAVELVDSFPRRIGSRHSNVHTWVTYGWSKGLPLHKMLEPILELNQMAMKYGDITQGSMAWVGYSYAYLSIGLPLGPLDADIMSFSKEARPFGVAATIKVLFPIIRQAINNLKVRHPDPTLLKGEIFDQEKELKKFTDIGLAMTLRDINSLRLMLACVYRDWATAETLVTALEPFLYADRWFLRRNVCLTYVGYASVTLGRLRKNKKRKKFRKLGKKIIKIYKGLLKDGNSDALPILLMLEAIESPSKKRFDAAIRTTARSGLVHQAAMLYENAGLWFMEKGSSGWAEYYLSEAAKLYGEWGAHGKTTQMLERYEFLRQSSLNQKDGGHIQGRSRFSSHELHKYKEQPVTSSLAQAAYDEKEDWM